MIKELSKGNLIDYSLWHPRWNMHSVLIVEHKKLKNILKKDSDVFKCINAQLNTERNPVEYLTWEQLECARPRDVDAIIFKNK